VATYKENPKFSAEIDQISPKGGRNMDENWFESHFGMCEHDQVRGYCITCTTAAHKAEKAEKEAKRGKGSEVKALQDRCDRQSETIDMLVVKVRGLTASLKEERDRNRNRKQSRSLFRRKRGQG
jgi:hypothetical protein